MKTLRILLVIAVTLVALGFSQGSAVAGVFTYTSSINVQNLENTSSSIQLIFYNQDGSIDTQVDDTISPLGSVAYFPIQATSGFNGSVVISSTSQVAAISNILGDNGAAAAAYVAANSGSNTAVPSKKGLRLTLKPGTKSCSSYDITPLNQPVTSLR